MHHIENLYELGTYLPWGRNQRLEIFKISSLIVSSKCCSSRWKLSRGLSWARRFYGCYLGKRPTWKLCSNSQHVFWGYPCGNSSINRFSFLFQPIFCFWYLQSKNNSYLISRIRTLNYWSSWLKLELFFLDTTGSNFLFLVFLCSIFQSWFLFTYIISLICLLATNFPSCSQACSSLYILSLTRALPLSQKTILVILIVSTGNE